ncbi:MAG TPA: hypothetical protein VHE78_08620 [Gemmatimonadaceae bacterium]|nr:hypothetical protein [Gemmatimonadaceae bacterium]
MPDKAGADEVGGGICRGRLGTVLFEGIFKGGSRQGVTDFDISPDGTQFLLLKTFEDPQIIIVHDWRDELRARLAAKVPK